jgi:hypothetical protein
VGAFDPRFAPADDWELRIRIARSYPWGFLDEVTALYRVHDQNVSRDQLQMPRSVLTIMDAICGRFPDVATSVKPEQIAIACSRALRGAAKALEHRGLHTEARQYWREAVRATGEIEASLAVLGGKPRLERLVSWYLYRVSKGLMVRPRIDHVNQ